MKVADSQKEGKSNLGMGRESRRLAKKRSRCPVAKAGRSNLRKTPNPKTFPAQDYQSSHGTVTYVF